MSQLVNFIVANELSQRLVILFAFLWAASLPVLSLAQQPEEKPEVVVDGTLHTLGEIMALLDRSAVKYDVMGMPDSIPEDTVRPTVLPPAIFLGSNGELMTWALPDSVQALYDSIEAVYQAENYAKAAELYKDLYKRAPDFTYALTLIGDAYVLAYQYDSAIVYLSEAIERNYIDYQAHWYLSRAYWFLNEDQEALREIHISHLLNPNHQLVIDEANEQRALKELWPLGGWRTPRYLIKEVEGRVKVYFEWEWMAYALVKALWQEEPGYREQIGGDNSHWVATSINEEKEAVAAYLADDVREPLVNKISADGNYDEFVIYEFLASKYPTLIPHMSREWIDRLADYLIFRDQYWGILSSMKQKAKENGGQ